MRRRAPAKKRAPAKRAAGVMAGRAKKAPVKRAPAKKRGGATPQAQYQRELAKYKAEHPRMSHAQAVQSFKKVYARMG